MGFYTESAKQMINPMDVPTFMIECAQSERKLFEGLIELDFAEVYCESGLAFLTEEETKAAEDTAKKSIGQVIGGIWTKFIEAIKKAYDNITSKLKEFFDKTSAMVNKGKILDDPKAKECTTEDIWYADYKKEADKINVLATFKDTAAELEKFYRSALEGDLDETALNNYYNEVMKAIEKLTSVPTTVDEYNANKENSPIKPVALGTKSAEFGELKKALNPGGIGDNIKSVFSTLSQKEKFFDVKEDDDEKVKKDLVKIAKAFSLFKLGLFTNECSIISKSCKIARRNFTEIAAYVKGGEKPAEEKASESAIYASYSDLLCESVFCEY